MNEKKALGHIIPLIKCNLSLSLWHSCDNLHFIMACHWLSLATTIMWELHFVMPIYIYEIPIYEEVTHNSSFMINTIWPNEKEGNRLDQKCPRCNSGLDDLNSKGWYQVQSGEGYCSEHSPVLTLSLFMCHLHTEDTLTT